MGSKTKVFVGLSGGVDSAVAAHLLLKEGFDVHAVFLKVFEGDKQLINECPWKEDMESAQEVASFLHIPFSSWNFSKEYKESVLAYFFNELAQGRTPNPDVLCNNVIKFGVFLKRALQKKVSLIATGHYAQIQKDSEGMLHLLRGADSKKDQSYFLSRMNQSMLSHVQFPIGHLTKLDIRKIASDIGLPNAQRPDSQGICFVGNINVNNFISEHMQLNEGAIVTTDGTIIGKHKGLPLYTIGQRHGIDVGGTKEPYYVLDKHVETETLVVGLGADHAGLYKSKLIMDNIATINGLTLQEGLYNVQIRYRQHPVHADISLNKNNTYSVQFHKQQRAITPGQFCVVYNKNECVASGIIVMS